MCSSFFTMALNLWRQVESKVALMHFQEVPQVMPSLPPPLSRADVGRRAASERVSNVAHLIDRKTRAGKR